MGGEIVNKTPWYPPEIKPVRKGWYECSVCYDTHLWTGKIWVFSDGTKVTVPFQWRGLTEKAK